MINRALPAVLHLPTTTNDGNDLGSPKEREEWEMIDYKTIERGVEDEWLHLTHYTTCLVARALVDDGNDEDGFEVVTSYAVSAAAAAASASDLANAAPVRHRCDIKVPSSTADVHVTVAKDKEKAKDSDKDKDKVQSKAEGSSKNEDDGKEGAGGPKQKIMQRLLSCPHHTPERKELVRERGRERAKRPRLSPPQHQLLMSKTEYLRAMFSDKRQFMDEDRDAEVSDTLALFESGPIPVSPPDSTSVSPPDSASDSASASIREMPTEFIPHLALDEPAWRTSRHH
jgi:hypothetical protein